MVSDSALPAEDGTEISYTCPRKQAKKGKDIKAVCQEGTINFVPGGYPDCSILGRHILLLYKKLGTYMNFKTVSLNFLGGLRQF